MQIKWEPGFDGNSRINQSRVEVKKVWEDWSMASIYRINGSTTNYLVPNLHPGDTYTVRVKSMNKHGISDWSQETRLSTKEKGNYCACVTHCCHFARLCICLIR